VIIGISDPLTTFAGGDKVARRRCSSATRFTTLKGLTPYEASQANALSCRLKGGCKPSPLFSSASALGTEWQRAGKTPSGGSSVA
jgi:hypothetical protein